MNIRKKEEKKSIDLKINDIVPEHVQKNIGKMIKDYQPMIQAQANVKAMVELFNTSVKISIPDTKQIQETINNFKDYLLHLRILSLVNFRISREE